MPRILIADPDSAARNELDRLLRADGHDVVVASDGRATLEALQLDSLELVVAETRLPDLTGFELLEHAAQNRPDLAVILLTAFGTVEDAVRAMRGGATDFLSKPFTTDQVHLAVERALEKQRLLRENQTLREALDDRLRLDNVVATDPRMQAVFKTVKAVAPTRTTVLLTGESGTGKTLLARAIHNISHRSGPFVEVNCGALPESLLESELFGHVRGAFTGAVRDRPGKFEAAGGGTIFLDEIGTSSPSFQVKLLRVLQDRVVERLGDSKTVPVDVRIVLATNVDLEEEVRAQRFREDLFYRINVVAVEMPPLRERPGDVSYLAEEFLRRFCEDNGKEISGFTQEAMDGLVAAPWPGNVRQLENVIERAVVLTEHRVLEFADLPPDLTRQAIGSTSIAPPTVEADGPVIPLKFALEIPEKNIIARALALNGGNRQATAAALGINRSTLFNKMRKFGLLSSDRS